MTVVQIVVLGVVAVSGGAVALITDPLRQTLLLGIYGLSLTMLFMALQAPDVALSEIVVSAIGLPVIAFAALRKIAQQDRDEDGGDE